MMVDAFVEYSYHVSKSLGDRVTYWITHNEPWCVSHIVYIDGHKPRILKINGQEPVGGTSPVTFPRYGFTRNKVQCKGCQSWYYA